MLQTVKDFMIFMSFCSIFTVCHNANMLLLAINSSICCVQNHRDKGKCSLSYVSYYLSWFNNLIGKSFLENEYSIHHWSYRSRYSGLPRVKDLNIFGMLTPRNHFRRKTVDGIKNLHNSSHPLACCDIAMGSPDSPACLWVIVLLLSRDRPLPRLKLFQCLSTFRYLPSRYEVSQSLSLPSPSYLH